MRLRRRPVIAIALIATAALVAFGAFALSGGLDRTVIERVAGGGGTRVVRVALVDAVAGFDVTPDELVVDRGTHVVLDVVNEGHEVHDLALDDGPRTRRLDPGRSQRLDLGTIARSPPELYCTLSGHRAAGMTFDIRVRPSG